MQQWNRFVELEEKQNNFSQNKKIKPIFELVSIESGCGGSCF